MKFLVVLALAVVACASADVLEPITPPELFLDESAPEAVAVPPKDLIIEDEAEERITNGWKANDGQFPYQAGMSFLGPAGRWLCGGSLISQTWTITAAHCSRGANSVTVYLGSTQHSAGRWSATVNSGNWRTHSGYNHNTLANDLTLVRIPAVGYTSYIRNIALPPAAWANDPFVNHYGTASGWGLTRPGQPAPRDLQYTYLQIIGNDVCQRTYGTTTVTGNTLCTSTPSGKSTCNGDSGGPLVLYGYDKLVGVISFVSGAGCQSGHPAGYVRVSKYLGWIRDHTGISG